MVVRATMQGASRSPASRGSLAATIGRLLVAGLAATAMAMSQPDATHAASQSRAGAPPLHDVGSPSTAGESSAAPDEAPPPLAPARTASATGKEVRPEDLQQQGNVVAVFDDPADPLIVIAVDGGYLTVRLRCGAQCPTIHPGDYVVAEGEDRSEAVFDADDVWIVGR
jgi:hypothetical protein